MCDTYKSYNAEDNISLQFNSMHCIVHGRWFGYISASGFYRDFQQILRTMKYLIYQAGSLAVRYRFVYVVNNLGWGTILFFLVNGKAISSFNDSQF